MAEIDLKGALRTDDSFTTLLQTFLEQVMDIPEEALTEESIPAITESIYSAFTDEARAQMIENTLKTFHNNAFSRTQVDQGIAEINEICDSLIEDLKPSEGKHAIIQTLFKAIIDCVLEAKERYLNYDIVLPMTLEEGAQVPTYAHDSDACADLYAAEDTTLPAFAMSNMIHTGVHIALPEGWMAMIFPRSSIGAKTSMRLSNSVGIIDSGYRGALGVLYDNFSDSDVEIKKGERIAQMLVMPSYKFKADVVDILPASDRGEGGFGSSGK